MRPRWSTALVVVALLTVSACQAVPSPEQVPSTASPPEGMEAPETRPFLMGFTRWPHDFTTEAVEWTWDAIEHHGDIVAVHLDAGVPWPEIAAGEPLPDAVAADLEEARRRSETFDTVYVAVTPLHSDRASIAHHWSDQGSQQPLPDDWVDRPLDDPEVIDTYLEYCRRVIEALQPDYFAYGIEVNAGYSPGSDSHTQLLGLARKVYPALAAQYPELPVFLTFQIDSWEAGDPQLMTITESLLPYTDIVGISAYPFLDFADPTRLQAEPEPVGRWMGRFADLGKPIAVTETGYIAEPLVIPDLGIDTASTPRWQAEFVSDLLQTSQTHHALFVIYWEIRDYDDGFQFLIDAGADPTVASIWKDIGLYDGEGRPRPALGYWDAWLSSPHDG